MAKQATLKMMESSYIGRPSKAQMNHGRSKNSNLQMLALLIAIVAVFIAIIICMLTYFIGPLMRLQAQVECLGTEMQTLRHKVDNLNERIIILEVKTRYFQRVRTRNEGTGFEDIQDDANSFPRHTTNNEGFDLPP